MSPLAHIVVLALLIAVAVLCCVVVWIWNARLTRELDRWGTVYNCKRWPDETNARYQERLRARIGGHWRGP